MVTSLGDGIADDCLVTLREAIVAANTNAASGDAAAGEVDEDIIRFDSSLAGGTINLNEGQLTILDDLSIQGGDFTSRSTRKNFREPSKSLAPKPYRLGA